MDDDRIPAEIMQRAYKDSNYDIHLAAELCGFKTTIDFERAIGLKPYNSRGEQKHISSVTYERACKIVQSLNLWPVDYGI